MHEKLIAKVIITNHNIIIVIGILCLIMLSFSSTAHAHVAWQVGKSQTRFAIDSGSDNIAIANHTTQLKLQLEKLELNLKPNLSYTQHTGVEVNLENSFLRLPLGIWSIYGGDKSIATSFYYQKYGKGYFAAISKEKDIGTSNSGMHGSTTLTAGVVIPKLGKNKKLNLTLSYNNAIDDRADRKYQTISIKSQQMLKEGHKFGCILSANDRTLNGARLTNYYTIKTYYEHLFRKGFTARFSVGLTYTKDYVTTENSFRPVFNLKLHMEL